MKTNVKKGKKPGTKKTTAQRKVPTTSRKKAKGKPIMLTTLIVGAVGVLGYFGWQYYRKRKAAKSASADYAMVLPAAPTDSAYTNTTPYTATTATPSYVAPATSSGSSSTAKAAATASGFPLKKGSKGTLVKTLQQALIAKHGAAILPKYGADGDFGSETVAALKKAGLPATIDESTYHVIIQGSAGAIDATALANALYNAVTKKDFAAALGNLKKLNTQSDYSKVSSVFSEYRIGAVRKTLVNGLLDAFTNEDQKQQIRYEFLRMGLKFDGSKWSLSGFDGRPVVTIEPTNVWINATERIPVPAQMVLGAEVSRKLDYTLFENNRRHFLVATKSVKYL